MASHTNEHTQKRPLDSAQKRPRTPQSEVFASPENISKTIISNSQFLLITILYLYLLLFILFLLFWIQSFRSIPVFSIALVHNLTNPIPHPRLKRYRQIIIIDTHTQKNETNPPRIYTIRTLLNTRSTIPRKRRRRSRFTGF